MCMLSLLCACFIGGRGICYSYTKGWIESSFCTFMRRGGERGHDESPHDDCGGTTVAKDPVVTTKDIFRDLHPEDNKQVYLPRSCRGGEGWTKGEKQRNRRGQRPGGVTGRGGTSRGMVCYPGIDKIFICSWHLSNAADFIIVSPLPQAIVYQSCSNISKSSIPGPVVLTIKPSSRGCSPCQLIWSHSSIGSCLPCRACLGLRSRRLYDKALVCSVDLSKGRLPPKFLKKILKLQRLRKVKVSRSTELTEDRQISQGQGSPSTRAECWSDGRADHGRRWRFILNARGEDVGIRDGSYFLDRIYCAFFPVVGAPLSFSLVDLCTHIFFSLPKCMGLEPSHFVRTFLLNEIGELLSILFF